MFSIQKIKEAEFFTRTDNSRSLRFICFFANRNSLFEFICFFANIIEKRFFLMFSIQKFKEAEFFTRTDKVASSEFASLQISIEKRFSCYKFSIQKFKEAEFFTRTDTVASSLFAFFKYYREEVLLFSIQKNQKGRIF
jgi:hypothetical protein